jgi:hypothetical protein
MSGFTLKEVRAERKRLKDYLWKHFSDVLPRRALPGISLTFRLARRALPGISLTFRLASTDFCMDLAIYWFAADYHEGQWSMLYHLGSTSGENVRRWVQGYYNVEKNSIRDELPATKMFYHALQEMFGFKD